MDSSFIRLAPALKEWLRLSEVVAKFSRQHELSDRLAASLQLICEEWFINIVVHGYREPLSVEGAAQEIEFSIAFQPPDEIKLSFRDQAPPFDPLLHKVPELHQPVDERGIGGLGIHLIRSIADECYYARENGCNHFLIVKKMGE